MTRYYMCADCSIWLHGGLLCDDCHRRDEAETRIESLSLAKEPTP